MTVPELIDRILSQLEHQFYCDLPRRDFPRDRQYLIGAIATYGYECAKNNWQFDTKFLYAELCRLLTSFKRRMKPEEIHWMPNYLQQAIRQHIREHAEELSAEAKRSTVKRSITSAIGDLRSAIIIEKTPAEQLGSLYKDVAKLRRQNNAARRLKTAEERKQSTLFLIPFAICHLPFAIGYWLFAIRYLL